MTNDNENHPSIDAQNEAKSDRMKQWLFILAAVLSYVVLADTAVETYRAGGPLKWWGLSALAGASALLLLLKRYITAAYAHVGLHGLLLALLAASAFHPAGLDTGFLLTECSTSEMLAALSLFSTALALILLASTPRVPSELKIVLGVLGLYSLIPFVLHLTAPATPFAHLFQGKSFWNELPWWIQGAPVALFFTYPLGLIFLALQSSALRRTGNTPALASSVLTIAAAAAVGGAAIRHESWLPPSNGMSPSSVTPTPTPLAGAASLPTPQSNESVSNNKSRVEMGRDTVQGGIGRTVNELFANGTPATPKEETTIPSHTTKNTDATTPPTAISIRVVPPPAADGDPPLLDAEIFDTEAKVTAEIGGDRGNAPVKIKWFSIRPDGSEKELGQSSVRGATGTKITAALEAPKQGFPAGPYRVDAVSGDGATASATFRIKERYSLSGEVSDLPDGYDIAPAAVGGRIEFASPAVSDRAEASNLINRNNNYWECTRCGWTPKSMSPPPEVVFSFNQGRAARVHAVVIDNVTERASRDGVIDSLPKYVEIFGSTTSPGDGFKKLGVAQLPQRLGRFVVSFPSQPAKFVKLRVLSTYGAEVVRLSSIGIIEDPSGGQSILEDFPHNIARFELGGTVLRGSGDLGPLIDGEIEKTYWRSSDRYLPQRLVFAFRNDQEAFVDRIVVRQSSSSNPQSWPKRVLVLASTSSPLSGYEELGEFSLAQSPAPQVLPIKRAARFIQLVVTENYGGSSTSFSEVEIYEGNLSSSSSILARNKTDIVATTAMQQVADASINGSLREAEPNDYPAQANQLQAGSFTRGVIYPLGENDHFKITVPEGPTSALTLALAGNPTLQTSLQITRENGAPITAFDPGNESKNRVDLSFAGEPGEYLLRFTQPPASIVLVWDISGSMQGRTEGLKTAVESFINQVRPTEQVQLVSFSNSVSTHLADFTNDRGALTAATTGHFTPLSGTAIYDAVKRAVELLEGKQGNRAIILMTDGMDTDSHLSYPNFWNLIEKHRTRVFTIGLGISMREFNPKTGTTGERLLAHLAQATYGRYFYAEGSQELEKFYRQISDELQSTAEYFVRPTLSQGAGTLRLESIGEKIDQVSTPEFQLILDASGSMRERKNLVGGRLKIDVAKEVMTQVVKGLPNDATAAFRVFGHRIREGKKGACEDSQLLARLTNLDKDTLIRSIEGIQALGTTALGYSLRQAALDFSKNPAPKIIIAVTDGKEECGDDPAQAVRDLRAQGLDVRVNVVGFDLAEESVKQQMRDVASVGGGTFFDARSADGLKDSISQALAVPFDVLDSTGKVVGSGGIGQPPITLPEGIYSIAIKTRGDPITVPQVAIVKDRATTVTLKKEGAEVGTQVKSD